ncbi:hypothetical protein ACH495_24810 [Micromonospora sp. NPDC018662]|uniref:hypothetical protein n=1 Tax=Micromonospora sp. NPDC018662 TaxID=3364238 RepID=UPI003790531C
MTRPEEPTEALPTRARPVDPAGAPEPTVYLGRPTEDAPGGADRTVHFGMPAGAVPGGADQTVSFGSPAGAVPDGADRTVFFGSPTGDVPGDADRTVHFGMPTRDGAGGAEPTRYLTAAPQPGGPYRPPVGTTAGAYRETTVDARAVSGVPALAPGGEVRFGPGVPVTPPSAPAWPVAPPVRARPVWRRVVSVLSTVLTAALLVAVGLYLWQRLRPLEVEQVSVAVPRPAGVACDVTVDVVATVRTNGRAGTIRYQWFRSDAPPGALLTERVGGGQRTATLTLRWTFSGVGATTGTATVNIVEPTPAQAGTRVSYRCPGG